MILQALTTYYERKKGELPPVGFEYKEIPFLLVINSKGEFVQLFDNRVAQGKGRLRGQQHIVPLGKGRSGKKAYETAYIFWDHYGYLLGEPPLTSPGVLPTAKDYEDARKQHAAFRKLVKTMASTYPEDVEINAVNTFISNRDQLAKVKHSDQWSDCFSIKNCNLAFKLIEKETLVCQTECVQEWVKSKTNSTDEIGICLVSGKREPIARLHNRISGVNKKPEPLCAINDGRSPAFSSYGKAQGFNFPVSEDIVSRYTIALNHLLRYGSPNRFGVGPVTTVCWSERNTSMETIVPQLFTDTASDRPDEGVGAVKGLFDSLHNGAYTKQDGKQRFFVLGLSPNASRIAVRFWQVGTVASFAERLGQWFNDIDVGIEGRRYPPIKALLRSTALLGKDENLPPHLVGETVRTILAGLPLPASVLQAVIKRIRSEQGYVSSHRAALIKACLNRKARYNYRAEEEISMGHNPEEKRIGYRLGCLFAVLEKLQKEANPNLNVTIRDKYYSSASCTPSSVFGTLMRLHTHHLKKMENSRFREAAQRRIAEVVWEIGEFPAHLSLEDQGLFAIGYYHQRQAFFTKKNDRAGTELRAESELA